MVALYVTANHLMDYFLPRVSLDCTPPLHVCLVVHVKFTVAGAAHVFLRKGLGFVVVAVGSLIVIAAVSSIVLAFVIVV